jgi:hypothetical protein
VTRPHAEREPEVRQLERDPLPRQGTSAGAPHRSCEKPGVYRHTAGHRDGWRREHRTRDRGRRDVPQRRADTTGGARPSNELSSSGGGRMRRMATARGESSGSVASYGQRTRPVIAQLASRAP